MVAAQPTTPCVAAQSSDPSTTRSAVHASSDVAAEDAAAVVLQRHLRATRVRQCCREQTAAASSAAATAATHGVAERLLPETAVTEEKATVVIQAQDRGMLGTVVVVGVEADGNEADASLLAALDMGDVAPKCVAEDSPGVVVDSHSNGEDREGEEDYDPEEERVPLAIPDEVAPGVSKEALLRLLGENGEDDIAEELYTPFPETVEDGDLDDGGADGYSSDEDEVEDDAVLSTFVRIRLDG